LIKQLFHCNDLTDSFATLASVVKQMKIIHKNGFSQQEIDGIRNSIHNCCLDAMKDLLRFMNNKGSEGINSKHEVRHVTFASNSFSLTMLTLHLIEICKINPRI
jgi:hypothetical protein